MEEFLKFVRFYGECVKTQWGCHGPSLPTPMNLNSYISVIADIDEKWFVIFEHTMNHLSFGYVHLPQLKYYFSCFASFFLFFFYCFSSAAIYF